MADVEVAGCNGDRFCSNGWRFDLGATFATFVRYEVRDTVWKNENSL